MKTVSIVWFRQDLRIKNNHALFKCKNEIIFPLYIYDENILKASQIGERSKNWLHKSLGELSSQLNRKLNVYLDSTLNVLNYLSQKYLINGIYWNRCYEGWSLKQEEVVIEFCKANKIDWEAFNSNYLWAPTDVLKNDGSFYKVFTAYKNKAKETPQTTVVSIPSQLDLIKDSTNKFGASKLVVEDAFLESANFPQVGEAAAEEKLNLFLKTKLDGYNEGRNFPSADQVSKLSAHLHFGEISPSYILAKIEKKGVLNAHAQDLESFYNEIIWREFSCYLLYHFDKLHKANFNRKFDNFDWQYNKSLFDKWKAGQTGYPLVDAGMRELASTGFMHNRVRMIVASFLIKNLNISWKDGMEWFWQSLFDADLASNSMNWQWVAGSGVDAAPFFRIFNPITQGEKFDKEGLYTKKFVPELALLPPKYLFKPWKAPKDILLNANIILGKTYPLPIIDFTLSRNKALKMYKALNSLA